MVSHVLGFVQKGGVHILKVSTVSSSTRIGKSRDKSFVLDLKLLFIIVDCFLGRFPPKFFTVKLVCFIGFPWSLYLILFNFPLCMILMLVFFFFLTRFIHNKSN